MPLDMTQQNIPELAKQGNPNAIAALLNRSLQPQGITAKAILKEDCLHLLLEGAQIPEQHVAMPILYEELTNLGIETIPSLLVYGRQKGVKEPAWSETIDLAALYPSEDEFVPMTGGAYASYEDDYAENSEGEYASEGVYSDEDAPVVASSGKKPRSLNVDPAQLKKLLPLLAIPIVLLLGLGVWWFLNRSPEPAVAPAIAPTAPLAMRLRLLPAPNRRRQILGEKRLIEQPAPRNSPKPQPLGQNGIPSPVYGKKRLIL
uniref:Uncharacterized protein n=1 Tax=Desertifilum tharense IPPAS B-1220 TaxID=1781255 RepID=A0ACD5GVZ4_9CYAN